MRVERTADIPGPLTEKEKEIQDLHFVSSILKTLIDRETGSLRNYEMERQEVDRKIRQIDAQIVTLGGTLLNINIKY